MTKTEIMEAAFKVWGREFYLNTSLSQVARELGVCKPALYRHFRNKDALFEAMVRHFFDEFANFVRPSYEKALKTTDSRESIFIFCRALVEFYARNADIFIFSMIKIQNRTLDNIDRVKELSIRGVDMAKFHDSIKKNYLFQPLVMRLINETLTFFMASFHFKEQSLIHPPSEETIGQIIDIISKITGDGFCYQKKEIDALNYEELENRIVGTINNIEDDPLLKAVAGAVAEAGPWKASMEQVARRSGLAKSSLYGHYKSKQDMLFQLFRTEYIRMNDFARQGIQKSAIPLEQLYLGIFSIVEYLRSKPDILVAMDWIRNRKLNLKEAESRRASLRGQTPPDFLRLFEDIDMKSDIVVSLHNSMPKGEEWGELWISPWILFLIVNTLMHRGTLTALRFGAVSQANSEQITENVPNGDIRFLFRFLTLGIGGFKV